MQITSFSTGNEITPVALAIHELVNRLPTTMRTKNSTGVRIEDGEILNMITLVQYWKKYFGRKNIRETPENGPYKGIPVLVVPLIENDEVIAAIGVVDTTQGIYSDIMQITKRPEKIKPDNSKGEFY